MSKNKERNVGPTTLQTSAQEPLVSYPPLIYFSFDPSAGYIPLSASRSAKRTATKAQHGSLLGLCLLPVAAIVPLEEKENTLVTGCLE
jgi:hypothetical protein